MPVIAMHEMPFESLSSPYPFCFATARLWYFVVACSTVASESRCLPDPAPATPTSDTARVAAPASATTRPRIAFDLPIMVRPPPVVELRLLDGREGVPRSTSAALPTLSRWGTDLGRAGRPRRRRPPRLRA